MVVLNARWFKTQGKNKKHDQTSQVKKVNFVSMEFCPTLCGLSFKVASEVVFILANLGHGGMFFGNLFGFK